MPKPPAGGLTGAVPEGGSTGPGGAARSAGARRLVRSRSRRDCQAELRWRGIFGRRAVLAGGEVSTTGGDFRAIGEFMGMDVGFLGVVWGFGAKVLGLPGGTVDGAAAGPGGPCYLIGETRCRPSWLGRAGERAGVARARPSFLGKPALRALFLGLGILLTQSRRVPMSLILDGCCDPCAAGISSCRQLRRALSVGASKVFAKASKKPRSI